MPIILMGMAGNAPDKDSSAFNYFLPKPVTPSSLFDAILTVFNFLHKDIAKKIPRPLDILKDAHQLNGLKILVIEDNPTNQEIAMAILEDAGIEVEIAPNGKIGVERIKNEQFDIVLMDMQMPVMDGYEATRIIRADPGFSSLPIIAMTANALMGDREKCIAAGMDDYITKPINQKTLLRTLVKFAKKFEQPSSPSKIETSLSVAEKSFSKASECPDGLAAFEGIDVQSALNDLGIEFTFFKKVLTGFYENNQTIVAEAYKLFDARQWAELAALAHSIKGSAANIRALKVQKAAESLETACKRDDTVTPDKALLDHLAQALDALLESLRCLAVNSAPEPAKKVTAVDSSNLSTIFHQLREALELSDPEDIAVSLEKLKAAVNKPDLKRFEEKVAIYDYIEASAILEEIAQSCKIDWDKLGLGDQKNTVGRQ